MCCPKDQAQYHRWSQGPECRIPNPSEGAIGQAWACIITSGDVPERLDLDDSAFFEAIEFVKAHMG